PRNSPWARRMPAGYPPVAPFQLALARWICAATSSADLTPPRCARISGVFICLSQCGRSSSRKRRRISRSVVRTVSPTEQPRSERGMIGEHAAAAGALERHQGFQNERLALAGPGRRRSFDHRVLAADLVGEHRHLEPLLYAAGDVEVWQAGLDHHAVGALRQVERDFAQRLFAVGRIHLVSLLVALEQTARADRVAERTIERA